MRISHDLAATTEIFGQPASPLNQIFQPQVDHPQARPHPQSRSIRPHKIQRESPAKPVPNKTPSFRFVRRVEREMRRNKTRVSSEKTRVCPRKTRVCVEETRVSFEKTRVSSRETRVCSFCTRVSSAYSRVCPRKTRVFSPQTRVAARKTAVHHVGWVYSTTASAIGQRIDDSTDPVGEYGQPTWLASSDARAFRSRPTPRVQQLARELSPER